MMDDIKEQSDSDLHVGIDFIDDEYGQLMAMLGALRQQSGEQGQEQRVRRKLLELDRFMRRHFDLEESILSKLDRDGYHYRRHSDAHNRILHEFESICGGAGGKDFGISAQFACLMEERIAEHLVIYDMELASLMKAANAANV